MSVRHVGGRVETDRAVELASLVASGAASGDDFVEAADSLRSLAAERDVLRRLDAEASTHVEGLVALRTDFSGQPPYTGWKGIGLSIREALDDRDALAREAGRPMWLTPADDAYRGEDLTGAQRIGLEAIAAYQAHAAAGSAGEEPGNRWMGAVRSGIADRIATQDLTPAEAEFDEAGPAREEERAILLNRAAWIGGVVLAELARRGLAQS